MGEFYDPTKDDTPRITGSRMNKYATVPYVYKKYKYSTPFMSSYDVHEDVIRKLLLSYRNFEFYDNPAYKYFSVKIIKCFEDEDLGTVMFGIFRAMQYIFPFAVYTMGEDSNDNNMHQICLMKGVQKDDFNAENFDYVAGLEELFDKGIIKLK